MDDLTKISAEVEKKTGVKTSPKAIEDIISAIKTSENFWQIVRFSQKPIPTVAETLKILKRLRYVDFKDDKVIPQEKLNQKYSNILPYSKELICPQCEGKGININSLGILEEFLEIHKYRPKPIQEYDQGNIDPASTVGRVALMKLRNDISGKKIIILGDDDLVGIALGLTMLPQDVLVLDIDKRLIDFTNKIAQEKKLPVRAEVFDLRKKLPDSLKGKFDVLVTDPPEAKKPFKIFIEKGIWSLKGPGSAGYIGMTLIDSSVSKWAELQKFVIDAGAVITDIIRDFNKYEIWEYHTKTLAWKLAPVKSQFDQPWYSSAIVRLELVKKPKVKNEILKEKDIYVDIESTTT